MGKGVMTPIDDDYESILADVSEMLREHFALAEWGRLVVELVRDDAGELRVSDVNVEDVFGDEAAVDRAFGSPDAGAIAAVLGKAIEALCALDDLDVDVVHGGTFVRADEGDAPSVVFLPGLVSSPSRAFDQRREAITHRVRQAIADLRERYGVGAGAEVSSDTLSGSLEITRAGAVVARGSHIVLGSFSRPHRYWVWGGHNPSLASEPRRRAKDVLDAMRERSAWEISTAGFATDEATAWALAGWIVEERDLVAPVRIDTDEGFVVLGIVELSPV